MKSAADYAVDMHGKDAWGKKEGQLAVRADLLSEENGLVGYVCLRQIVDNRVKNMKSSGRKFDEDVSSSVSFFDNVLSA